jgi:outer membrane protein TolC
MKALPLLLLLPAAIAAGARADDGMTLAQVLDAVLTRHPTIEAAQAAVDGARGRLEQSASARLPQVSANGSYAYTSLRPVIRLPGSAGGFYTNIQNSYNVSVGVRQLLTDFGRTDALVAMARAGEMSAQDALEQVRDQLGYQAIQSFYGVLLLRQSVGVADEEIRSLEEAERISERKLAGGTATRFDVLTTQVRLANARNGRTDTIAALEKQEAALRELLGSAPGTPLALSGGLSAPAEKPDLSAAIAEGLQHRPEIRLARDGERVAGLKLDAADRENRPSLSAQAAGGMMDGVLPEQYDNRGYLNAGVSLSVPLFTGNRITGERVEARADLRAAQARIAEATRAIATDVSDACSDLTAAQARLASAAALVAQAQEALALAKSRYANGVITNFELLDAQSNARAAELARLQANYDCILAGQAIARASGKPPAAP